MGDEQNSVSSGSSIMSDMDKTEQLINSYFHRLEVLERSLKYNPMTSEERVKAEQDVEELKNILLREENRLQSLRKTGRGNAYISVIIMFMAFLFFGLYKMYMNPNTFPSLKSTEGTKLNW